MKRRTLLLLAAILTLLAGRVATAQQGPSTSGLFTQPVKQPLTQPTRPPRTELLTQPRTEACTEGCTELPDNPTPKQDQTSAGQQAPKKGRGGPISLVARRSLVYPELATTPGPLSVRQKFELFLDKSISPPQFLGSLAAAGVTQALNRYPGYGQGATGYADRFGATMATGASSNFFGTFLVASMFHEDPRYFPRGEGRFGKRVGYALTRVLITRMDDGREGFNWWNTTGQLAAEGLANAYLPYGERHVGKTLERYGIRMGFSAANNVVKEYWPTIFKSLGLNKIAPGLAPNPPRN